MSSGLLVFAEVISGRKEDSAKNDSVGLTGIRYVVFQIAKESN